MARDPLDEDGRLNGVDVIVDGMENARGRNEMRASHKDLLSVQQSMVIEWWLALVSVQDSADSMAAASSS